MDSIFVHESAVINTNPSDQNKWINLIFMICLHYPRLRSLSIFTDWPSSVFLDPGLLGPEVTITHAPRAAPVVIRTAASVKQSGADITFDDWSKEIFITELQIQVKSSTAFWYHIRRQDQVTNRLYRKQIFGMMLPNSYFSESIKYNNNESCEEGIRPGGSCQNILSGPESCQLWLWAIVGLKALKGWPDHHNGAVTRLMPQI